MTAVNTPVRAYAPALLAAFVPVVGLVVVVPCLLAARRAGVKTTPYVIALAVAVLWIVVFAGSVFAQSLIEPEPALITTTA